MLDESSVPILNNLNFFDFDYLNDHSDIPNDEERSDPILNRYGTPSPHPGSTFEPLNESGEGHSHGLNVVASEEESFEEAAKHQPWVDVMNSEIDALYRNNTWDLVDLPKGRKAIDVHALCLHVTFPKNETRVCKLNKSLYGLKQALRQWNAKLTYALVKCGFVQSKSDYSLFTKKFGDVSIALLVYVNDIIIIGNNLHEINKFKQFLKTKFVIKDLGKLKYFLGIEFLETSSGICLNQMKYCLEIIDEFGLLVSSILKFLTANISLSSETKG
ncbi:ribonuclease H-like domain-containing protein [Tanacetum coccineum]|uniref:Ribonuclease H-like domain-containing protein n=1 Tax=Tanacetum coccineum TaxID=301880 RepID=A0ABQ4YD33_9ASTR